MYLCVCVCVCVCVCICVCVYVCMYASVSECVYIQGVCVWGGGGVGAGRAIQIFTLVLTFIKLYHFLLL